MPALNYKKQFAAKVESGEKRSTIRAQRKRPIRQGDRLYHYTGMRTQRCRKLLETNAEQVACIFIDDDVINIDGETLLPYAIAELARGDGFANIGEFKDFFRTTHGLPFVGQLIEW